MFGTRIMRSRIGQKTVSSSWVMDIPNVRSVLTAIRYGILMIRLQRCRFQTLCIRDGAPLDGIELLAVNCATWVPTNTYSGHLCAFSEVCIGFLLNARDAFTQMLPTWTLAARPSLPSSPSTASC